MQSNASSSTDMSLVNTLSNPLGEFDFASFGAEVVSLPNEILDTNFHSASGLSDWYYNNQQMMNLLDEDVMF